MSCSNSTAQSFLITKGRVLCFPEVKGREYLVARRHPRILTTSLKQASDKEYYKKQKFSFFFFFFCLFVFLRPHP